MRNSAPVFAALLLVCLDVSAAQETAGWDSFPVFVWRQDYRGRALPHELAQPFGGTNVDRGEAAPCDPPLSFFVGHAPGRDDLHLRRTDSYLERFELWYATRDPRLLVREPCLLAEDTRARLFETLERSLGARDGNHGLGIALGDEVSLTPWGDPSDVCCCARCEAAWSAWSDERGYARRAPTTDAVRRSFADGDWSELGAWLARREFHQEGLTGLLEELAAATRTLAPGAPIGLLGMAGRSTFGGVAVERVLPFLDFVEVYPVDDARELFAALRTDERSLATVFPEAGGPDASAWLAWEHVLRGGDGLVLWSDRTLAADPALRARLAGAVVDLRAVRGRVGAFRPAVRGAAVVHSPASMALAWLRDALLDGPTWPRRLAGYQREHGTRERSLRAWLRLLEDAGALPGALPVDAIDAETVERFPLLVLAHVEVLSASHVEALERYLAAGGSVVVEGEVGLFDERGEPQGVAVLERLARAGGERVRAAPERVSEYAELRRRPESGRAQALRATLRSWLAEGASLAPFEVEGGRLPWLTACERRPTGVVCMALPNATTPAERAGLAALEPRLRVPEGARIEWIHPPAAGSGTPSLAAGDALVFRLVSGE